MLYLIVSGEKLDKALLVKADTKEEVEKRLKLEPDERIIGSFTSHELDALSSASFAVISS